MKFKGKFVQEVLKNYLYLIYSFFVILAVDATQDWTAENRAKIRKSKVKDNSWVLLVRICL